MADSNWSELPLELLGLISNLTNTSSEIRRFRSVCHSWRSSVTVKPLKPFESPSIINLSSFSSQQTPQSFDVRLIKQTTFLLSLSSHPNSCWVLKTEEHKQKPGVFTLITPFSNKNFIKNFGYNILDLSNLNIFEIGHEYVVRNVSETDHNIIDHEKVAFSFVGDNDEFILLSTHNSTGKLLMYRSNFQEWTFLDDFALGYNDGGDFAFDWSMIYVDVVSYNGRFYAVTDSGRTVVITFDDDMTPAVNLTVKSITGGDKKCLVKSAADLLLVDLYTCSEVNPIEINAIDVFKLDTENNKWVVLKSLGGRSIFLSNYSSFSTDSVHGINENCIYFSFKNFGREFLEKKDGNAKGDCYDDDDDVVESSEIGVFKYDKGCFGSLEDNTENSELFSWPPPSWLKFLR